MTTFCYDCTLYKECYPFIGSQKLSKPVCTCSGYLPKHICNKIKTNTKSGFLLAFKCAIDSPFKTIITLKTKTTILVYTLVCGPQGMKHYNQSIRKAISKIKRIPAKILLE